MQIEVTAEDLMGSTDYAALIQRKLEKQPSILSAEIRLFSYPIDDSDVLYRWHGLAVSERDGSIWLSRLDRAVDKAIFNRTPGIWTFTVKEADQNSFRNARVSFISTRKPCLQNLKPVRQRMSKSPTIQKLTRRYRRWKSTSVTSPTSFVSPSGR